MTAREKFKVGDRVEMNMNAAYSYGMVNNKRLKIVPGTVVGTPPLALVDVKQDGSKTSQRWHMDY